MPPNRTPIHYISSDNLSLAWAAAFLEARRVGELSCITVSVHGFEDGSSAETPFIRRALDDELARAGKHSCETVANTIFPDSLWNRKQPPDHLWRRYTAIAKRLRHKDKANQYGRYFDRMMSYGPDDLNQLQYIIDTWASGNHRRSALQAVIVDPSQDSTNQRRRGFPCLSQVSFGMEGQHGLVITGYYPTQTVFDRAYGNYLGLVRLGSFMAAQMDRVLTRMNCVAVVLSRDFTVGGTKQLADALTPHVEAAAGVVTA